MGQLWIPRRSTTPSFDVRARVSRRLWITFIGVRNVALPASKRTCYVVHMSDAPETTEEDATIDEIARILVEQVSENPQD